MLKFNFNNQRVLVAGGTRGIGRGISQAFIDAGAYVMATYVKNEEKAHIFLNENEKHRSHLQVKRCDHSDLKSVKELFAFLQNAWPSMQILVNNLGIRRDAMMAMMEEDDWHKVLNTNLSSSFYTSKEAILHFFLNSKYGRIINIGSLGGQMGIPGQTNYAASKAGLEALGRSLSKEVAKKGITVNTLAPGFVDTELMAGLPEAQLKDYKKMIPLKRFGRVDEVSSAVLFLASRESSYITGSTLEISGGL